MQAGAALLRQVYHRLELFRFLSIGRGRTRNIEYNRLRMTAHHEATMRAQRPDPQAIIDRGLYRIRARRPLRAPNLAHILRSDDPAELAGVAQDAARYPGGRARRLYRLTPEAGEAEIAWVLHNDPGPLLAIGSQTSLTGGGSPRERGDTAVIDLRMQRQILHEEAGDAQAGSITVQAGLTVNELQQHLQRQGRDYPAGPTHDGATVGGIIATNAGGPQTFRYGQTRAWVRAITVVLADGSMLDIPSGTYFAHPAGYFEVEYPDARVVRVPVPQYVVPDLAKVAAGYNVQGGDLLNLFVGAEGTLGIISQATLRTMPLGYRCWAMLPCASEAEALALNDRLIAASPKGQALRPDTLNITAIEYIDAASVDLLRADSQDRPEIRPHARATTLLLVQIDMARDPGLRDGQLDLLLGAIGAFGNLEDVVLATPNEPEIIELFMRQREAVPIGVNRRISAMKDTVDPRISKAATDMIVPPHMVTPMMAQFRRAYQEAGIDVYCWGHSSDGNFHFNAVPKSYAEYDRATQLILRLGRLVIDMGGCPLSEHGVGRSWVKQRLLRMLYGSAGIAEMAATRLALDPTAKLAPGVLTPL